MSAWPEAVWIVKNIQKNFDFSTELNYYTTQLNSLNSRINNLIDRVAADENNLNETAAALEGRTVTFFGEPSTENPNVPRQEDLPTNYGKGTIWLVLK